MPKYPLKAWADPWQRNLSKTVTVSRVDEDIPTEHQPPHRKPWYIALTQKQDLLADVGGVRGLPDGTTLLLAEDDVVALVRYLLESQLAAWSDNPSVEAGDYADVAVFVQPGMVALTSNAGPINGEGHWRPKYFKQLKPIKLKNAPTDKIHTLPWKKPRSVKGERILATDD